MSVLIRSLDPLRPQLDLLESLSIDENKLFQFGDKFFMKLEKLSKNLFWKEVFLNLYDFINTVDISDACSIYQPLWFNSNILIGGKPVMYNSWYDKGIRLICDLFDDTGCLMTYESFSLKYAFRPPITIFQGLKNAITKKWNVLKQNNSVILPSCPNYVLIIMSNKKGTKNIYDSFINKINKKVKQK